MAATDLFMCVSECLCVGELTTVPMKGGGGQFSPSTLRVQGIKLRLSDTVVSVFIKESWGQFGFIWYISKAKSY